jgi:hypothetical protein
MFGPDVWEAFGELTWLYSVCSRGLVAPESTVSWVGDQRRQESGRGKSAEIRPTCLSPARPDVLARRAVSYPTWCTEEMTFEQRKAYADDNKPTNTM